MTDFTGTHSNQDGLQTRRSLEEEALANPSIYEKVVSSIVAEALKQSQADVAVAVKNLRDGDLRNVQYSLGEIEKAIGSFEDLEQIGETSQEGAEESLWDEPSVAKMVHSCTAGLATLQNDLQELRNECDKLHSAVTAIPSAVTDAVRDLARQSDIKGVSGTLDSVGTRQSRIGDSLQAKIAQLGAQLALMQLAQKGHATKDDDEAAVALIMARQQSTSDVLTSDMSDLRHSVAASERQVRRVTLALSLALVAIFTLQVWQLIKG